MKGEGMESVNGGLMGGMKGKVVGGVKKEATATFVLFFILH